MNLPSPLRHLPLFGACAALLLAGCGEDYLDEADVFRDRELSTFYQTEDDALLAVNATYAPLQYQGAYRRYRYLLDYMSGDLDITTGGRQLTAYPMFQFDPASPHLVPAAWSAFYTGISRANVVLERVPAIEFLDQEYKDRLLGEAYFLRGLYYFDLVRLYGGVPLYTEPFDGDLTGAGFQPGRASREEVYDQIEEDLALAASLLPNEYDGADVGRATAGAAQAFLGTAQLYQREYAAAAATLRSVIDGEFGMYELVDYEANFGADNENNAESVFEVQFANGIGRGFSDGDTEATAESNWIATALNPGRQRAFANGVPSVEVDAFFREREGDAADRRRLTIARPGDVWGVWDPIEANPVDSNQWRDRTGERVFADTTLFLGVRKGVDGPNPPGFVQSPINHRVLRFAEVLLLFAEAANEANGGPTPEAYEAINRVRARAGADSIPDGLSRDEFFAAVAAERRLELTFEFKRFFDLVRWTEREGVIPEFARATSMPGFQANKNEVLPIPSGQLIANPNLVQNPGYAG